MKIDDNYHITTDTYNWILNYESDPFEHIPHSGKNEGRIVLTTTKDQWFFPNLKGCLNKYLNQTLKQSPTLESILVRLTEVEELINNLKTT